MTNTEIMRKLIVLIKPLLFVMFIAILFGVLGFLASTFITIFGGYLMLDVLGFKAFMSTKNLIILLIIMGISRGVLRYVEQVSNHYIAFKLLALIRDKVFTVLRKLAPAKLESKDKGNLIALITSDIELLEVFYAHTISPIIIALIMSIIMTIYIGSFNIFLGIIALLAYITVGIIQPVFISRKSHDIGRNFRNENGNLNSYFLDSLRGLNETLQYNEGQKRSDEIIELTNKLSDKEKSLKEIVGLNISLSNAYVLIFSTLMMAVASYLYIKGVIPFNYVVISTIALFSSFGPVIALANLGTTLQMTFASGERVLNLLEEEPQVLDIVGKETVNPENLRAENIEFAYDKELILDNVSVDVNKNAITGIMGKSGSGKSTLLRLFMRFFEVNKGSITFENTSIDDINTSNLRKIQSFVTQDTHLFNDSIKNNILVAKLDATDEEIIEACKKASVHDFIMSLDNGYDTNIGELGDMLSSGEKQRIGLARSFLHEGKFILLDEPTSNLDTLNESIILRALEKESENKSIVLVSHRKSTMSIANTIYKIDSGRIS